MERANAAVIVLLAGLAGTAGTVGAAPAAEGDREAYQRRAAEADLAAFRALDLDGDGRLTRAEARPDLRFGPRFDDADIDRDGVVTGAEMERYLAQAYGYQAPTVAGGFDERPAAPSPR